MTIVADRPSTRLRRAEPKCHLLTRRELELLYGKTKDINLHGHGGPLSGVRFPPTSIAELELVSRLKAASY